MSYYIEAIEEKPLPLDRPSLFLGGGITDCPDWQAEVTSGLSTMSVTIINPRRADFPMGNPDAAMGQIVWEHRYLQAADAIMFWFPEETLCPITLFELGSWINSTKPLFLGCHPNYARRLDVLVQTSLVRREQVVHDHLGDVLAEIRHWIAPETYF